MKLYTQKEGCDEFGCFIKLVAKATAVGYEEIKVDADQI